MQSSLFRRCQPLLRSARRSYYYDLGVKKNIHMEAASGLREITYQRFEFNGKTILGSLGLGIALPVFLYLLVEGLLETEQGRTETLAQEVEALNVANMKQRLGIEDDEDDE